MATRPGVSQRFKGLGRQRDRKPKCTVSFHLSEIAPHCQVKFLAYVQGLRAPLYNRYTYLTTPHNRMHPDSFLYLCAVCMLVSYFP